MLKAVKSDGVVMHIGLQDWDPEIDMRKLTLAEITLLGTYTYTSADLRATVRLLNEGLRHPGLDRQHAAGVGRRGLSPAR